MTKGVGEEKNLKIKLSALKKLQKICSSPESSDWVADIEANLDDDSYDELEVTEEHNFKKV